MALRKSRDGTWIVDVSNGINPISLKQRRIVRKGFKTKKEALEAEQYLRSVELKEKSFNSKATSPLSNSFPESAMQALCNSRDFP